MNNEFSFIFSIFIYMIFRCSVISIFYIHVYKLKVTNPANNQQIGVAPDMTGSDVESAVQAAHTAFQTWRRTTAKVK